MKLAIHYKKNIRKKGVKYNKTHVYFQLDND